MNIYESIAKVQADVEFISKNKQVQSGGSYKYRGVDQVLNTLHPLFAKHKVFAVPEVLEVLFREERNTKNGNAVIYEVLRVKYNFYAEDGTSVSAIVVGEAMDSGDKASNKCMSVAYKYACFQILSIPTEENTQDPDDENQPLAPKQGKKGGQKQGVRGKFMEDVTALGVEDAGKTVKWLEEQYGKPLEEFDKDDLAESLAFVRGRQERKKQEANGD